MATTIGTGFLNNSPLPLDSRSTQANGNPWATAADAISGTRYPSAYRKPGKTVLVAGSTQPILYWFNNALELVPFPIGQGDTDGNKVEITKSGNTWTINTDVITPAKLAKTGTGQVVTIQGGAFVLTDFPTGGGSSNFNFTNEF